MKIASRIRNQNTNSTYGGLPEDFVEQVPHLGGGEVLHGTGVLGPHKAFVQLQRSQDPRHPTHRGKKDYKVPRNTGKKRLVYILNRTFSISIFKPTKLSEIWHRGLKSGRRVNKYSSLLSEIRESRPNFAVYCPKLGKAVLIS
jgi:hypothetical protein